MRILVLSHDLTLRQRLKQALVLSKKSEVDLVFMENWAAALEAPQVATVSTAIVSADDGKLLPTDDLVRLRDRLKPREVVIYTHPGSMKEDALAALSAECVPMIFLNSGDSPHRLRGAVASALVIGFFVAPARAELTLSVGREPTEFALRVVMHAPNVRSCGDLAARLHTSARSMRRHAATMNLPSPERLFRWGRLLHCTALLRLGQVSSRALRVHIGVEARGTVYRLFGDLLDTQWPISDVHRLQETALMAFIEDVASEARCWLSDHSVKGG